MVGVLLQTVLTNVAYYAQNFLGYAGGAIIILFGLFLLGFLRIPFLEREHKIKLKRRFKYAYVTSFLFGAAFAVGIIIKLNSALMLLRLHSAQDWSLS